MRVAILHARAGWHTDQLCRALARRGHSAHVVRYEGLTARLAGRRAHDSLASDGIAITECDAVLPRIIPSGSLEQLIFRVDALHWLEDRGLAVVNSPRAIERTVDKFYTSVLLRQAGVPTPDTIVCESAADAMAAVRALGDVVVKPIFGSMGHGLVRISDPDAAFRLFKSIDLTRGIFYVQQRIEHGGSDLRLFVIGDAVVGAIQRHARDGDWRCNVSRGATARSFTAPPPIEELARRATAAVGAEYAGVDIVQGPNGEPYVLEVNGIPGWEGLQRTTDADIAAAIVLHLEHRVTGRSR